MPITWTCPECDLIVAPEHGECPGESRVATDCPPTRQTCLEKSILKIEALTSVLDHAPDRPATEADFAVITANNTLALLLKPHGKERD